METVKEEEASEEIEPPNLEGHGIIQATPQQKIPDATSIHEDARPVATSVSDDGKTEASERPASVESRARVAVASEETRRIVEEELMKLVQIIEENVHDDSATDEKEKPDYEVLIEEAKEEIKDLNTENKVLQRRLLALQKRRSTIGTKLFLEGAETQYQNCLKQWMAAKDELDRMKSDYDNKIDKFQELVREKQKEARELHQEFSEHKWQVARDARHIYSGRHLSSRLLEELQAEDLEADMEIERLRIEGRQLASQLKKTQQATLKKDQLPGGLFAVDFEQLQIENEALNEKLAKKNKELAELGSKTTHIVHVLSHSREKLQFVQKETEANATALEALEVELNKDRSELQHIEISCERLALKRARMQNVVNIRKPFLLDDMETNRDEAEASDKKVKELKQHYDSLVKYVKRLQQSILQHSSTHVTASSKQKVSEYNNLRWGVKRRILGRQVTAGCLTMDITCMAKSKVS